VPKNHYTKKHDSVSPGSSKQPVHRSIQVILDPLPLPPDFNKRLATIYALALQRYREHAAANDSADNATDGAA
jgi:hypothetical protein